jgi:uncharacterized membrane protein YvbJ
MAKTRKKQIQESKNRAEEKKLFMWAGIITIVALIVIYVFFIRG